MSINIIIQVPEMTPDKYAEATGLTVGAVKGMAEKRQLPVCKAGRRLMINCVERTRQLAKISEE